MDNLHIQGIEQGMILWTYKGQDGSSLIRDNEVFDVFLCENDFILNISAHRQIKRVLTQWMEKNVE